MKRRSRLALHAHAFVVANGNTIPQHELARRAADFAADLEVEIGRVLAQRSPETADVIRCEGCRTTTDIDGEQRPTWTFDPEDSIWLCPACARTAAVCPTCGYDAHGGRMGIRAEPARGPTEVPAARKGASS
jgi:hypothetical protein